MRPIIVRKVSLPLLLYGLIVNYLHHLRAIQTPETLANQRAVAILVYAGCTCRAASFLGVAEMIDNLFTAFRRTFPEPSRIFLERPDGTTLSYGDLLDLSGRVATVLVELGVRPGDRVVAQVEKSAEALMPYLGTLRAGAVCLPLNTAYTAAEIRYFLGDAEPATTRAAISSLRRGKVCA